MISTANLVVLLLVAVVSAAVSGLIVARVGQGQRRQLALLLDRLAEVEAQLSGRSSGASDLPAEEAGEISDEGRQTPAADTDSEPSNDPLSGKTSFVRRVVTGGKQRPESLAEETLVIIYQRLGETITATDLAGELNISLRTLERGVSAAFGCTPSQLITAMKMREARRLLASGVCRVNEVALQLDFCSPQHFSRRFKAFYGVAPKRVAAGQSLSVQ